MIAGAFSPNQFVAESACTSPRLAGTNAGCTVAANADSNAVAMAAAWVEADSAWAAVALRKPAYCVATPIIAVADGPCHAPLTRSEVTVKNDDADDANSS